MGQTVGRMPHSWIDLLEEKDRVLYWSGEVLSRVADNVNQEESFLIDYGNESIDKKVDSWMESNQARIDRIFSKHPDLPEAYKIKIANELEQVITIFIFISTYIVRPCSRGWFVQNRDRFLYSSVNGLCSRRINDTIFKSYTEQEIQI